MTARGEERPRVWIEARSAPWGWTVHVYVLRPGRQRARSVRRWIARDVKRLREALGSAAAERWLRLRER